jgi:hypothetical protein
MSTDFNSRKRKVAKRDKEDSEAMPEIGFWPPGTLIMPTNAEVDALIAAAEATDGNPTSHRHREATTDRGIP